MNLQCDQLPIGLIAQLVCTAMQWYPRGHGFKSCSGLNFFQAFFFANKGYLEQQIVFTGYTKPP